MQWFKLRLPPPKELHTGFKSHVSFIFPHMIYKGVRCSIFNDPNCPWAPNRISSDPKLIWDPAQQGKADLWRTCFDFLILKFHFPERLRLCLVFVHVPFPLIYYFFLVYIQIVRIRSSIISSAFTENTIFPSTLNTTLRVT